MLDPVFIVGQYKCGTSWLLAALCAHPDVLGLREIDVIRAACDDGGRRFTARDVKGRLDWFFHRSAWSSGPAYDQVRSRAVTVPPMPHDMPQSIRDLTPEAVDALTVVVEDPEASASAVLDAFLHAVTQTVEDERRLILKAADQMAVFDTLRAWQPHAPALAITRDGRDAALSARAYRALMAKRDAPWLTGQRTYDDLLTGWAGRARILLDLARSGEILLIRYEDLTESFEDTLGLVLSALGIDGDREIIQDIRSKTDFEAVTGRSRGETAESVLRRGMVGEWQVALSADEQRRAWGEHGEVLSMLGYRQDGDLDPLDRSSWKGPRWSKDELHG